MTVPHSTGTPAEDVEELEFYTHRQDPVRFSARFSDDVRMPERAPLLARQVTLSKGWRVIQYRLPRSAHGGADAYGALEREVSAAVAVERQYGAEPYSELFTRLVGFHLDAPEPFVLYKAHAGRPVAERQGALTMAEQHKVLSQLALAVRLLEDVQLVHRDINPYTVRWDGTHVRLGELYRTQRVDEPREAFGAAPWAAPEQRDGSGTADPRDDLWSVARLMYFLLSGRPGDATAPPEDLDDFRRLAALSEAGAFAPRAETRAAPAELMRLLNVGDPLAAVSFAPDPLGRARAEFDARLAEKRDRLGLAAQAEPEEVYVEVVGPPPRRSLRRLLGAGGRPPPGRRPSPGRPAPWTRPCRADPRCARTACCRCTTTRRSCSRSTARRSPGNWTSARSTVRCTVRTPCARPSRCARTRTRTSRTGCPSPTSPAVSRSPSPWSAVRPPARPICWPP